MVNPRLQKRPKKLTSQHLLSLSMPAFQSRLTLLRGEIKVVTWNVASWNAVQGVPSHFFPLSLTLQQKGLKEYLKNEDPDIICFNETKIDQAKVPEDKIPGYHAYFYSCEYNAGYAGTAYVPLFGPPLTFRRILSKTKPLSVKYGIGVKEHDTEGRCITAEYEKFYLIATYIPNAGEKDKDTKMPKKYVLPINREG